MHRFIKWLGTRLYPVAPEAKLSPGTRRIEVGRPPGRPVQPAIRQKPATRPKSATNDPALVEFDTDMAGYIDNVGPGKNVLIRHHLLQEESGNHEALKILDDAIAESGEKAGFDPYNTGKFDRAENWRARTWK